MRKVIDSLAAEVEGRLATDGYRNLPVMVRTANSSGSGVEPIVVELLRTRLVERNVPVDAACGARCMEVSLQEFTAESAKGFALTPGQVLTFAGGQIPIVGSVVRGIGEQAREQERAARRATGFIVTFAAREANRYTARSNVVVISSGGEAAVAPGQK
ncbi:MAG: hypothetical protein ACT4P3_16860 [Betaproteobacteria bacterium]